jgi:hypothetical protein
MLQFKQLKFFVFIIDILKRRCFYKTVLAGFIFVMEIFTACSSFAQTDTTIVDTISMAKIDSLTQPENADEYDDTTVKHIYDTSQYFFNWKEDFHQPYTKEKFAQRHLIDNAVDELKKDDNFWYVPAIEKIENRLKTDAAYRDSLLKAANKEITSENETGFNQQRWFRFLMWFIIIGVFLAAVIYFLFQNKINLFSRESTSATDDSEKNEHENIFELSYFKLIQKAETEQNYRVAIRLMFLQTLKILSDTNHIKYQPDYTNLDYLQQMHSSDLYKDFFKLTHHYEYVWYGKFEISAEKYAVIKNNFLMLQNKIT